MRIWETALSHKTAKKEVVEFGCWEARKEHGFTAKAQ